MQYYAGEEGVETSLKCLTDYQSVQHGQYKSLQGNNIYSGGQEDLAVEIARRYSLVGVSAPPPLPYSGVTAQHIQNHIQNIEQYVECQHRQQDVVQAQHDELTGNEQQGTKMYEVCLDSMEELHSCLILAETEQEGQTSPPSTGKTIPPPSFEDRNQPWKLGSLEGLAERGWTVLTMHIRRHAVAEQVQKHISSGEQRWYIVDYSTGAYLLSKLSLPLVHGQWVKTVNHSKQWNYENVLAQYEQSQEQQPSDTGVLTATAKFEKNTLIGIVESPQSTKQYKPVVSSTLQMVADILDQPLESIEDTRGKTMGSIGFEQELDGTWVAARASEEQALLQTDAQTELVQSVCREYTGWCGYTALQGTNHTVIFNIIQFFKLLLHESVPPILTWDAKYLSVMTTLASQPGYLESILYSILQHQKTHASIPSSLFIWCICMGQCGVRKQYNEFGVLMDITRVYTDYPVLSHIYDTYVKKHDLQTFHDHSHFGYLEAASIDAGIVKQENISYIKSILDISKLGFAGDTAGYISSAAPDMKHTLLFDNSMESNTVETLENLLSGIKECFARPNSPYLVPGDVDMQTLDDTMEQKTSTSYELDRNDHKHLSKSIEYCKFDRTWILQDTISGIERSSKTGLLHPTNNSMSNTLSNKSVLEWLQPISIETMHLTHAYVAQYNDLKISQNYLYDGVSQNLGDWDPRDEEGYTARWQSTKVNEYTDGQNSVAQKRKRGSVFVKGKKSEEGYQTMVYKTSQQLKLDGMNALTHHGLLFFHALVKMQHPQYIKHNVDSCLEIQNGIYCYLAADLHDCTDLVDAKQRIEACAINQWTGANTKDMKITSLLQKISSYHHIDHAELNIWEQPFTKHYKAWVPVEIRPILIDKPTDTIDTYHLRRTPNITTDQNIQALQKAIQQQQGVKAPKEARKAAAMNQSTVAALTSMAELTTHCMPVHKNN